jgi:glycosyltransferase involved in cell wall biosynthesis
VTEPSDAKPRRRTRRQGVDAATGPSDAKPRRAGKQGVSVIVPTRNAADWVVSCLEAIRGSNPDEVILVDGHSDDGTVVLAEPLVDRVIRDDGRGPGAARNLGIAAAGHPWLMLVDVDVVLPQDAISDLVHEARDRGVQALQATLRSTGTDYWSEQLAWQHNNGRSRSWFGVSATLIRTEVARAVPFDSNFRSGEDIDLRIRLAAAGIAVGVSDTVEAVHRFAPTLRSARSQWADDGAGLGRLVRKLGPPALRQLVIPFGAAAYWIGRSVRMPRRLPYFIGFLAGNWRSALAGLFDQRVPYGAPDSRLAVAIGAGALLSGAALAAAIGFVLLVVIADTIPGVPQLLAGSAVLPIMAVGAVVGLVLLEITATMPDTHRWAGLGARYRSRILGFVVLTVLATALRLLADLRLLR